MVHPDASPSAATTLYLSRPQNNHRQKPRRQPSLDTTLSAHHISDNNLLARLSDAFNTLDRSTPHISNDGYSLGNIKVKLYNRDSDEDILSSDTMQVYAHDDRHSLLLDRDVSTGDERVKPRVTIYDKGIANALFLDLDDIPPSKLTENEVVEPLSDIPSFTLDSAEMRPHSVKKDLTTALQASEDISYESVCGASPPPPPGPPGGSGECGLCCALHQLAAHPPTISVEPVSDDYIAVLLDRSSPVDITDVNTTPSQASPRVSSAPTLADYLAALLQAGAVPADSLHGLLTARRNANTWHVMNPDHPDPK